MYNRNTHPVRRRGVSLIYASVLLIAMFAIISFAVDLGRVQLAKTELQQAADSAARYGAAGLAQGVAAVKSRVADAGADNKVDGAALVIDTNSDVEFGTWNAATKTFTVLTGAAQSNATAVRVTARRSAARGTGIPTLFAALLGRRSIDVSASAVASSGIGSDVVVIQDITSSFAAELADAKVGDQALVDALYAGGGGRAKVGLVAHTGWGKTMAPLVNIGTNYSALCAAISSLNLCGSPGMPICSGTDIAAGFDEAIKLYSDPSYVSSGGGKAVILVSDGEPSSNTNGSHPTLNDTQLLALAQTRADDLWALNVNVYIVFFNREGDAAAASRVSTLVRGSGEFVEVTDATQLPVALYEITKKLPIQLVR